MTEGKTETSNIIFFMSYSSRSICEKLQKLHLCYLLKTHHIFL